MIDVSYLTTKVDWDKLRIFNYVAWSGSLTKAANKMSLSQSAVSRQITALEDMMGCRLFRRQPRGLVLTEAGETLFSATQQIFGKISHTLSVLKQTSEEPTGHLRLATTEALGFYWLLPNMAEFIQEHPSLNVSYHITDDEQRLSKYNIDILIKPHPTQQLRMIQRLIFSAQRGIYASKEYLEKAPPLKNVRDLGMHHFITYLNDTDANGNEKSVYFLLSSLCKHLSTSLFTMDSYVGVLEAVAHGAGVGVVCDYMAARHPQLVRLLPEVRLPPVDHYLIYSEELRHTKKIIAFRDFVLKKVQETFDSLTYN